MNHFAKITTVTATGMNASESCNKDSVMTGFSMTGGSGKVEQPLLSRPPLQVIASRAYG